MQPKVPYETKAVLIHCVWRLCGGNNHLVHLYPEMYFNVSQISVLWCCTVPCIFLGAALSECQSAWTWDLRWLPAGQRWALRASHPWYALSWPSGTKIRQALPMLSLRRHRNVPRRSQGFPVPPLLHSLLRQQACWDMDRGDGSF